MNLKQTLFAEKMIAHAYKAKRMAGDLWLPASIMAAQSILESSWGKRIPTGEDKKISDSQVEITASQAKIVTLIDSVDRRINGYKK